MDENITLTRAAFVEVLEASALGAWVGIPSPDDPGPVGPAGPVIRRREWALLNPKPLPPRWALSALGAWGPQPEPWRSAEFATGEISRVVDQVDAAVMAGADDRETGDRGRAFLSLLVDEWCATPYRRWPGPRPRAIPGQAESLHPVNLIFAGAQLHRAAEAMDDHPLPDALAEGSERLLQTGLDRSAETETCMTSFQSTDDASHRASSISDSPRAAGCAFGGELS